MNITTYIARRFMLGGKGAVISRFTGWVAIIGMIVGCLALIISIAILNGFEKQVTDKIIGFEGDLRITATSSGTAEQILSQLQSDIDIQQILVFTERKGIIINSATTSRMVQFKATDISQIADFYKMELDQDINTGKDVPIIIGRILADRLDLNIGDEVRIMSPIDSPIRVGLPKRIRVIVAGIFKVNILDYDDRLVFIPIDVGRSLFTRKKGIDGFDLRLENPAQYNAVGNRLANSLGNEFIVESWADLHEGLFQAMRLERIGAIIVLSLIILVAAFNLTSTLVLVTYQKVREIGILRTVGATSKIVRAILIKQGFLIGGTGAAIGVVTGLFLIYMQSQFGIIPLPGDIYAINTLPVLLTMNDIILVPMISLVLIYISSFIAAKRAMLIQPKEAVHLEK
ncbi:FtsX-like permease family protein [Candidatus Neomarinimicrobiota bacterium]